MRKPDWKAVAEIDLEGTWSNDPETNAAELVCALKTARTSEYRAKIVKTIEALGFELVDGLLRERK